jgi:hypothetical protein
VSECVCVCVCVCVCNVFNDAESDPNYVSSCNSMMVNNEWQIIFEELVVA